ncbi:MAG: endonuclease/exonuclease/phosphatase family protein [Chlamydiales bacterium]|nr:endonuclease/exonuclease/phosphatase family protein [Chlamydiales bacterium]
MRSQFTFTRVLGSAIFISQLALNASVAEEPRASFATSREIERYAVDTIEKIHRTAVDILSTPSGEQTFENTLRPWNRLSAQLSQDLDALNALSRLDVPSSETAAQVADGLQAYLWEVDQSLELHQTLIDCSMGIAQNPELDPFQRYIGARFIRGASNEPVYLCGSVEEGNSPARDYAAFSLKSGSLQEAQVTDLAHKILSANADAICVQEVVADVDAYDLYKVLRAHYAHFVYVPPSSVNDRKRGMLIASKFRGDLPKILLARSHGDSGRGGASAEVGVSGSWGNGNGIQWEGYVKGEAHDGQGNYVEGQVTQRDDGTGQVDVRGGHESNDD